MKFRIAFIDACGVHQSLIEAASCDIPDSLSSEEQELIIDERHNTLHMFVNNWIEYDEFITIEFDTVKRTAVVVPL
jgi:hypothetical protein